MKRTIQFMARKLRGAMYHVMNPKAFRLFRHNPETGGSNPPPTTLLLRRGLVGGAGR
jgi:hypothetical protein